MKQGMTLAGTGHRPLRLGGYDDSITNKLALLASTVIGRLQPSHGYCGGALGWDMAWGEALLNAGIPYTMALPFPDMGSRWFHKDRVRLQRLIHNSTEVQYLSDRYSKSAYILRDRYMVDNAEGLVCLLDPNAIGSGTHTTYKYAEGLRRPILQLWNEYIAL